MPDTLNKSEIIAQLKDINQQITATVTAMPTDTFFSGTNEVWSPANYLKHLIMSVKPFAGALRMPRESLGKRFGTSNDGSTMSYDDLEAKYHERIDNGIRAEDFASATPTQFRYPDNIAQQQDNAEKAYLTETWQDACNRLEIILEEWDDLQLDVYQLPHPALSLITLREMCYFTILHNNLHHKDIQAGNQ